MSGCSPEGRKPLSGIYVGSQHAYKEIICCHKMHSPHNPPILPSAQLQPIQSDVNVQISVFFLHPHLFPFSCLIWTFHETSVMLHSPPIRWLWIALDIRNWRITLKSQSSDLGLRVTTYWEYREGFKLKEKKWDTQFFRLKYSCLHLRMCGRNIQTRENIEGLHILMLPEMKF